MKPRAWLAGCLLAMGVAQAAPADFASQWPLQAKQEGAWTVAIDEGIYRQVTRADLADLAAYNADGEELAFGPLPPSYGAPASTWHDAVWFALPTQASGAAAGGDLQLHVTRSADGTLSLDSTLTGSQAVDVRNAGTSDLFIDVRAKDRVIEAIAFDFAADTPDFSAVVSVEASDDLQHWRTVAADAPLASFRQHGQYLLRRKLEFAPESATYLRLHASMPLPLAAVHQLQREPGTEPARSTLDAAFVRREGRAFIYRLPARIDAQRLSIRLADDNAVARFSVQAREEGDSDWRPYGSYTAFRLRGAGVGLDAEPMEIDGSRLREWRIESDTDVAKTPTLRFDYRPESWVVLTHGRAPYILVAGSKRARRGEFPIDVLMGQLRARYGAQWQPSPTGHGPMQAMAGDAALTGWDASQGKTWLLWGVLLVGVGVVGFMVVGLLRSAPKTSGKPGDSDKS